MMIVSGLMMLIYLLALAKIGWLWRNVEPITMEEPTFPDETLISILIPVRNEADHIGQLIDALAKNNFPKINYEIIIINDHSTDETIDVVAQKKLEHSALILRIIENKYAGKKQALTIGVEQAIGKLMICTDGDSLVPKEWIMSHYSAFVQGAKLSFGCVQLINSSNSRLLDALNVELTALVSIGGATLQGGSPTMINGCNYSFEKPAFLSVGGFSDNVEIATGDDEFLLRTFHERYTQKIKFIQNKSALVETQPPFSFLEFYNQRRRWASKWKHHKGVLSKLAPLFLFGFHLSIWILVYFSIAEKSRLAMSLLGLKVVVEYVILSYISSGLKLKLKPIGFLIQQFLYPIYVVFFGIVSNFGTYEWRSRKHKI